MPASSVGSLTNPRKIAATFTSSGRKGVSETTIKRYLSALEDAFMVSCAARYDVRLSRDENGIVTMSLRDFLLNPQSLDL